MIKKLSPCISAICLLVPLLSFPKPIKYPSVGYIELDRILHTYIPKYLETQKKIQEEDLSKLEITYNREYAKYDEGRIIEMRSKIRDKKTKLEGLKSCIRVWNSRFELEDDGIFDNVQRDVRAAIKQTAVVEGFSLILDASGNFVYGNEDVNLTDKVLLRLDWKLLRLVRDEPDDAPLF